jgi:exodeoxyribonuclease VII large subunit
LTKTVQQHQIRLSEAAGALRPASLSQRIEGDRRQLAPYAARMTNALGREVRQNRETLDRLSKRLSDAGQRQVEGWHTRLDGLERLRQTLGYEATLERGYAVVRGDGDVVTTLAAAASAAHLEIQFADGRLAVGAGGNGEGGAGPVSADTTTQPVAKSAPKSKPKASSKSTPPEQGKLF